MGRGVKDSYDNIGLANGDDSLLANVDAKIYVKTCSDMGEVTEVIVHQQGDHFKFLARIYGVWGEPDSMCDVNRQFNKLHLTIHLPVWVTPMQKLFEKTTSLELSDANTPLVGELCKVVALVARRQNVQLTDFGLGNYLTRMTEESGEQYPNRYGLWMLDAIQAEMPDFDVTMFYKWLADCSTDHAQLLSAPLFVPMDDPKGPMEAHVDGGMF
jgi:hypothetical protein